VKLISPGKSGIEIENVPSFCLVKGNEMGKSDFLNQRNLYAAHVSLKLLQLFPLESAKNMFLVWKSTHTQSNLFCAVFASFK